MSVDDEKRGKSSHLFTVRHQHKQRLLLRALELMDDDQQSPAESKAITAMIVRLEEVLARRERRYTLDPKPRRKRRKRCAYGSRKNEYNNDLDVRG